MPKPVYILCSESGSEDKTTSLVSHFKVLEEFEIRESPAASEGSRVLTGPLSFQIVAVWARAVGDASDQVYEIKTSLFLPPDGREYPTGIGTISFGNKARFRMTVTVGGIMLTGPGSIRVENRIRPLGAIEDSWLVQSYEIPVIDLRPERSAESALGE
jgi:hypothetical protein